MDPSKELKVKDNIYGHLDRVSWFEKHVPKEGRGLEFGCGTGIMITATMLKHGYDMYGIDLDEPSIELGQQIFRDNGLDAERLMAKNLDQFPDDHFDYIIATEVIEHIEKADIDPIMELIKQKTKPDGILIITVPNGYGHHEIGEVFWTHLGLKRMARLANIPKLIRGEKGAEKVTRPDFPTTIADSPHVRRFTLGSIKKLAEKHGFEVYEARGSALFADQLTDMLFSNNQKVCDLSHRLGEQFPAISSGFYLATKNRKS